MSEPRRIAQFRMTRELLQEFLSLPAGMEVVKIAELPHDPPGQYVVYVESDEFPGVPEGGIVPTVTLTYQEYVGRRLVGWNLPDKCQGY